MNREEWLRLIKFSLVGAIGICVQLGVLILLIRANMNYLLATALAVEAAVLHNFLWHQKFTWADRKGNGILPRLLRFHASNGFISVLGNLLAVHLLVAGLAFSVTTANMLAIVSCCAANFIASDNWVFCPQAAGSTDLTLLSDVPVRASKPASVARREHR